MLLSANVSSPPGTGPAFGLYPDASTWSIFVSTPLMVGNPFHFPTIAPVGFFPNVPFNVGPGGVSSLTGLSVDAVVLLVSPGPLYDSKSNLVRHTFQ
jgi:hypothetical protein